MIRALLVAALTIPLGLDLYLPAPEGNPRDHGIAEHRHQYRRVAATGSGGDGTVNPVELLKVQQVVSGP